MPANHVNKEVGGEMGKLRIGDISKMARDEDPRVEKVKWYSKCYVSRVGNAYHIVDCPVCGLEHHLYPWSLAGSGKKCENKDIECQNCKWNANCDIGDHLFIKEDGKTLRFL